MAETPVLGGIDHLVLECEDPAAVVGFWRDAAVAQRLARYRLRRL